MTQYDGSIQHRPFFAALASCAPGSGAWRATRAGLVALRLVDAWLGDLGTGGATAVRDAATAMDDGDAARALLLGLVDAIERSPAPAIAAVAPLVMEYGRALDYAAQWALAEDVYRGVAARCHVVREPGLAVDAALRAAYCARMRGALDDAAAAYDRAARVAAAAGDVVRQLRVRVGRARLAADRGNLPEAERLLDATIRRARADGLDAVCAAALHDRAIVARRRGRIAQGVRFAYDALDKTSVPSDRDRVLSDIATMFVALGVRTVARDAFLVIAATAQERAVRWTATINLLEIASVDAQDGAFEMYRRELDAAPLAPWQRAEFLLHAGEGHERFGRRAEAEASLRRAAALAEEFGLNRTLFAAEASLARLAASLDAAPASSPATEPGEAPADLGDVVLAVTAMRAAAGYSG